MLQLYVVKYIACWINLIYYKAHGKINENQTSQYKQDCIYSVIRKKVKNKKQRILKLWGKVQGSYCKNSTHAQTENALLSIETFKLKTWGVFSGETTEFFCEELK